MKKIFCVLILVAMGGAINCYGTEDKYYSYKNAIKVFIADDDSVTTSTQKASLAKATHSLMKGINISNPEKYDENKLAEKYIQERFWDDMAECYSEYYLKNDVTIEDLNTLNLLLATPDSTSSSSNKIYQHPAYEKLVNTSKQIHLESRSIALSIVSKYIDWLMDELAQNNMDYTRVLYYAPSDSLKDVYDVVDQMPEFPGGMAALMQFLSRNLKYPAEVEKKGIQGRVIVSFVVEKDGSIICVQVEQGVEPLLDKEAVRVCEAMPRWKPGKNKGENVRVKFHMPITFRLK